MTEFTLRQLSHFVAVAEEGTITEAAKRLYLSPSALSSSIGELERALGVQLCVRRKAHGITLTPSGKQVLEQGRTLLRSANEIHYAADNDGGELTGPITLGCYITLAPTILPALLAGFGTKYPRVSLGIVEGTQDELQRMLAAGEIDAAVVYDMQLIGTPNRVRLYEAAPYLIVATGHRLAGRGRVRLDELAEDPLILVDSPPSSEHALSLFADRDLHPRIEHRSRSYETVRSLVARGLGYSMLVQRPRNDKSYEGLEIVPLEIDPAVPGVGVDLIWLEGMIPTARLRALIDMATLMEWPPDARS